MSNVYLIKHRNERDVFEVDLSRRLSSGETLVGAPTVLVSYNKGMEWADVTSDFVVPGATETLVAKIVRFTLKPAELATQRVGEYTVYVRSETTQNRLLVATVPLFIIRAGT